MTGVVFLQGGGVGAHDADALLAASLQRELGNDFRVDFPEMPLEGSPDYERWRPAIAEAIARAEAPVVLVGHSLGGYMLLKYLASSRVESSVPVICIISAPFPSGDEAWTFDWFDLPDGFAGALPPHADVFLYASEDDEIVPFAHRDLYAAAIPGAAARTTTGGHQLGNELGRVAADIVRAVESVGAP